MLKRVKLDLTMLMKSSWYWMLVDISVCGSELLNHLERLELRTPWLWVGLGSASVTRCGKSNRESTEKVV
jgi:hypothetical protein